jgi:hypothetical protein
MAYTTIKKPSDYFNTKLYTGNGSTQSITGVGFQPDLLWFKNRDSAINHMWFDSVRGIDKYFYGNLNEAEGTSATILTAIGSDGFSVGANNNVNGSGNGIASWNWLANGAGVSNTDGSITSTVSANTTSGFSIVSYTGTGSLATVGHGLGVTPKMIIVKTRGSAGDWSVYHSSLGNTKNLKLNTTAAEQTSINYWNNTSPDVDKFTVNDEGNVNGSSVAMIAYCFAEVKGFSKFGSYVGNGSADGTFIYTGFAPSFVLIKNTTGDQWLIKDNKRPGYNPNNTLYANLTNAEDTSSTVYTDFLSNGFKLRGTYGGQNTSNVKYIYMAFAEQPLVGDNPATAR